MKTRLDKSFCIERRKIPNAQTRLPKEVQFKRR